MGVASSEQRPRACRDRNGLLKRNLALDAILLCWESRVPMVSSALITGTEFPSRPLAEKSLRSDKGGSAVERHGDRLSGGTSFGRGGRCNTTSSFRFSPFSQQQLIEMTVAHPGRHQCLHRIHVFMNIVAQRRKVRRGIPRRHVKKVRWSLQQPVVSIRVVKAASVAGSWALGLPNPDAKQAHQQPPNKYCHRVRPCRTGRRPPTHAWQAHPFAYLWTSTTS